MLYEYVVVTFSDHSLYSKKQNTDRTHIEQNFRVDVIVAWLCTCHFLFLFVPVWLKTLLFSPPHNAFAKKKNPISIDALLAILMKGVD